jgi:hypothetical protein
MLRQFQIIGAVVFGRNIQMQSQSFDHRQKGALSKYYFEGDYCLNILL